MKTVSAEDLTDSVSLALLINKLQAAIKDAGEDVPLCTHDISAACAYVAGLALGVGLAKGHLDNEWVYDVIPELMARGRLDGDTLHQAARLAAVEPEGYA